MIKYTIKQGKKSKAAGRDYIENINNYSIFNEIKYDSFASFFGFIAVLFISAPVIINFFLMPSTKTLEQLNKAGGDPFKLFATSLLSPFLLQLCLLLSIIFFILAVYFLIKNFKIANIKKEPSFLSRSSS